MQPDRFTIKAQEAVAAASRIASESRNTEIAPAHLLLALLDNLIERLPAQWTLALSTRVAPPLALGRWRAAGELAR